MEKDMNIIYKISNRLSNLLIKNANILLKLLWFKNIY